MAIRTVAQLKAWFRRGQYPTEGQFGDLIDSFRHKDDGVAIIDVAGLAEALNGKYERSEGEAMAAAMAEAAEKATGAARDVEDLYGRVEALAEAGVGLFDHIILNRNSTGLLVTLENDDIVYSMADKAFYRYWKKVDLDPLAIGGGSSSKGQFWPLTAYMDGDAPDASILFRRRSTAELYRYDADAGALVHYLDVLSASHGPAETLTAEEGAEMAREVFKD